MPGGSILQAPFSSRVSVARAEKLLTGHNQSWVRERARRGSIQQHLCCFLWVRTSVFIAFGGRSHEFPQEVRLLFDFVWTGDKIGRVVIGNAVVCNREDIQFNPCALRLDHLPTLEHPCKIDAVRLQCLHSVDIQGHILKLSCSAIALDDLAYYRRLIRRSKAPSDFATQVTRLRYARTCQGNQRRGVVLDDRCDRDHWLVYSSISYDSFGGTDTHIGLAIAHQHIW